MNNTTNTTSKGRENPYTKAGILSKIFFCWLTSLFFEGHKKQLGSDDLYDVLPDCESKYLGDKISKLWNKEQKTAKIKNYNMDKNKRNKKRRRHKIYKPSLFRVIFKLVGWKYISLGIVLLFKDCVIRIGQAIFLSYLIRSFDRKDEYKDSYIGWIAATGIIVTAALHTSTHHPYFFGVQKLGMKVRVAVSSLIYRKVLRLSQTSLTKKPLGHLVNILSNDVNRLESAPIYLHYIWIAPLQLVIVTIILWRILGPTCLIGLVVLLIYIPFQGAVGRFYARLKIRTAEKTDKRIRLTSEILAGIKAIKMYTYELLFLEMVSKARKEEINLIKKQTYLRALNMTLYYGSAKIMVFATLVAYVLANNKLNAENVFVTLALYNILRVTLTMFFPNAIITISESIISIRRIEAILNMEEYQNPDRMKYFNPRDPNFNPNNPNDDSISLKKKFSGDSLIQKLGIEFKDFSAKWTPDYDEYTLNEINLQVEAGELVAVIGKLASGKGSLLQAILKELPASKGSVVVNGSIAYSSQEPFLFSGTIESNILFGSLYDRDWYLKVIEVCALSRDFSIFPKGDKTVIADRGSSLSGGQKARINLARAVYSKADIYLLDDVLSAVDAAVGRHIFEKCINGILKNKTRVLVTHQLHFLETLDHIVLFEDGKITFEGPYRELIETAIDFKRLSPSLADSKDSKQSIKSETFIIRYNATENVIDSSSISDASRKASLIPHASSIFSITKSNMIENEDGSMILFETETNLVSQEKDKTFEIEEDQIEAEGIGHGKITFSLYYKYFSSGTSCFCVILFCLLSLLCQIASSGTDSYLSFWTKAEKSKSHNHPHNFTYDENNFIDRVKHDRDTQIYVYTVLVSSILVFGLLKSILFFHITLGASVHLHNSIFYKIMRAQMIFFETTLVGRILNRLSKDLGIIDDTVPITMFDVIDIILSVFGAIILIGQANPYLVLPALVISILMYAMRRFYLKTARVIKRLEGTTKSPVFNHLNTSFYGLTTIRAFIVEEDFYNQFDELQNKHTCAFFLFISSSRWFGNLLDWIAFILIITVVYSFLIFPTSGGANVGLAVSAVIQLTSSLQYGIRQSAELENQMVSVERVIEYKQIKSEGELKSDKDKKPPDDWPSDGLIEFENVELNYGKGDPILKNITINISPSEKLGVVGRSGAGKSSLITALFRLEEPSGTILIDKINIQSIGLHDLRRKISIIPQDPFLFSGTLRENLDLFGDHQDSELWFVLKQLFGDQILKQFRNGLDSEIGEGGSNLSLGQKQLIQLARAILKKNKILILDEASANIDEGTDELIQSTLRNRFKNCTVITVAHRLNTVVDSNRIMILESGNIKEIGQPYELLLDTNSELNKLAQQSGKISNLIRLAKNAALAQEKEKEKEKEKKSHIE